MLFGRRKPGYTTTVDGAADPEQVVLDLQKAEMAAKKKPTSSAARQMTIATAQIRSFSPESLFVITYSLFTEKRRGDLPRRCSHMLIRPQPEPWLPQ